MHPSYAGSIAILKEPDERPRAGGEKKEEVALREGPRAETNWEKEDASSFLLASCQSSESLGIQISPLSHMLLHHNLLSMRYALIRPPAYFKSLLMDVSRDRSSMKGQSVDGEVIIGYLFASA